uniref:Uncharacterized protein n=1 Tax=Strigamia maritima TaxID=126957 RepID=T1J431_STRMM
MKKLDEDFNSALRLLPFSMKIEKKEEIVRKDKRSREPNGLKKIIEEFASVQLNQTELIDYYSKRLAIESSLIEDALASTGVFDSTTVQKIFAAANPDQTICQGVLVSLEKIKKWIINHQFDAKKLFQIHHDIVRNSRIDQFSECPYIIAINEYRHVNVFCESTLYPNWEESRLLNATFFQRAQSVDKG